MSAAVRPQWWLIGNPENRRVTLFQAALQQAGLAPARVIPYVELLARGPGLLAQIAPGSVVRIESPGENFAVEQRILALGGVNDALALAEETGRIWYPGAWFAGFTRLMAQIRAHLAEVVWFNHPDDIVTMFDKPRSKALLAPHALPACPAFGAYAEFLDYVRTQRHPRFFVKLSYSSSASGVVAYAYHPQRDAEMAWSTVELAGGPGAPRFFNTLKIRRYQKREEIRTILDFLFAQGALVEPWIPKSAHDGAAFDLRVLGIGGTRQHAIARLSHSPMTNLHLGNRRCAVEDLALPGHTWAQIDTLVADTMRHFPRSLYAGLDVLLPRGGGAPMLLEANAFGDLLPNLLHEGRSTWLAEILALCEREGLPHAA